MTALLRLRVVRTTAYLKSTMEVYGKTFTGPGPKEEYQACFVRYFGCYVCDLLNAFDALF